MTLKCLAVLLALGMLGGYVWTRQQAVSPEAGSTLRINEETGFPITPSSPTLFDTSKSGKLTVDPVLFSTSKSGPVDLGITLAPGEIEDPESVSEDAPSPVLMPGSKSINMPVFNPKDLKKGQNKIDALIQDASGEKRK